MAVQSAYPHLSIEIIDGVTAALERACPASSPHLPIEITDGVTAALERVQELEKLVRKQAIDRGRLKERAERLAEALETYGAHLPYCRSLRTLLLSNPPQPGP